ncbi:MAG: glycosyltransferase family 4 protein [Gammaproteobacteria bacterium]|nr:glycosyltransferase family 4 protein [Gammaproteobacteria bacterium]MBU2058454.1 glycosyltransferase family 4 protein [Gammaproteobacteria bacterium]MBU2176493.1 glycosyltransferase family 4 protein [Gammaproteobacteria bacterium]MBU2248565.1 glycosyltransferase family 4 protein [Gammaproteobacteria bacterium]MBU2345572.1 glycosyltransferase family 4 protein [Gammaproteobacteria bacterium]
MRILVVSQYFWPEDFRINDLCKEFQALGHEVTILTGVPNYPAGKIFDEYSDNPAGFKLFAGMDVIRVPIMSRGKSSIRLLLNYLSFALLGSIIGPLVLRKKQFDVIFVCQLSPITVAIPAIVLKRLKKIPLVMWSLDLWPDSVRAVGKGKSDVIYTALAALVKFIYRRCDLIAGQSTEYLSCIQELDDSRTKTMIFPNWAEELFQVSNVERTNAERPFTVLFAGNIGEAQDFDSIVSAAKILKERKLNMVFSIVGDGSKYQWLKNAVQQFGLEKYFVLHGRYPLSEMPKFYNSADAALLCLKSSKIFEVTVPGKLQSYMMSKLPVLAMINGAGGRLVDLSECGYSCAASDFVSLANNIEQMLSLGTKELNQLGNNGLEYATKHFSRNELVHSLCKEMQHLVDEGYRA